MMSYANYFDSETDSIHDPLRSITVKRILALVLFVSFYWASVGFCDNFFVIPVPNGDQSIGDATPADVRAGKTFSNATDSGLTGTMPDATETITPGSEQQPISAGYHDGTGYVEGDYNFKGENIVETVVVFGVNGEHPVVDCWFYCNDIYKDISCYCDGLEDLDNRAECLFTVTEVVNAYHQHLGATDITAQDCGCPACE